MNTNNNTMPESANAQSNYYLGAALAECSKVCKECAPLSVLMCMSSCMDDYVTANNTPDPFAWLKDHGYEFVRCPGNEIRAKKVKSCFDLVFRQIEGRYLVLVEFAHSSFDECPAGKSLAMYRFGSDEIAHSMFLSTRNELGEEASICTCEMPRIVALIVGDRLKIEDKELLLTLTQKLTPFGTKRFGKKNTVCSDAVLPWDLTTKNYICFAPKEIEAIVDTCVEVLKEANTAEKLANFNMSKFTEILASKANGIPPTKDIAFFGRYLHNSGLTDYKPVIGIGAPKRIG